MRPFGIFCSIISFITARRLSFLLFNFSSGSFIGIELLQHIWRYLFYPYSSAKSLSIMTCSPRTSYIFFLSDISSTIMSSLSVILTSLKKQQQDCVPEITHILLHSYLQPGRSEKTYIFELVEMMGIEPMSESIFTGLSPSAAFALKFRVIKRPKAGS